MSQPARHAAPTAADPIRGAHAAAPRSTTPARSPGVEAAPSHLRVVERADRSAGARRRRARLILAGGTGAALAVMFGLVYLHVTLAQRQIQLDQLSARLATDTAQYQGLRLQVAELESPQQIISVAEGRLGMRQPATVTYVSPPAPATSPVPPVGTTTGGASPADPRTGGTREATSPPVTVPAPAGDADWPAVKAALAGLP